MDLNFRNTVKQTRQTINDTRKEIYYARDNLKILQNRVIKLKEYFKEGRPRISKIKIDHALSLLEEGYSYKQVESMTGISTATLARRKRERILEEEF